MTRNRLISRLCNQRRIFIVVTLLGLFFVISSFRSVFEVSQQNHHQQTIPTRPSLPQPSTSGSKPKPDHHPSCPEFANEEGVQIIVKSGANEIFQKLPTQLITSLSCYPKDNLLFFSDLEQDIGPYHIFDVLAGASDSLKTSPEFAYYRALQGYKGEKTDISQVKIDGGLAWDLDKYKFIPMMKKTWELKPRKKWYVFIEADTYMFRTNLLLWLDRLNETEKIFLGSPMFSGNQLFAHGGSGIILTGTTLEAFTQNLTAAAFDEITKKEAFGDLVVSRALLEKGFQLLGKLPIIQFESPESIPFRPLPAQDSVYWCEPSLTTHHITPDEASRLWEFEQKRADKKKPILIREIYDNLISPYIINERDDWDNLSDEAFYRAPGKEGDKQKAPADMTPIEKEAYSSFENCQKACEEQQPCHQFRYDKVERECSFMHAFRLGHRQFEKKKFRSGWLLERIAQSIESNRCIEPKWV